MTSKDSEVFVTVCAWIETGVNPSKQRQPTNKMYFIADNGNGMLALLLPVSCGLLAVNCARPRRLAPKIFARRE
jgi:hypothetical protein